MGHSFGFPVGSDWEDKAVDDPVFGIYKNCGFWTEDEAEILYQCAIRVNGPALDIGCHSGWTTACILESPTISHCTAVDPMLRVQGFLDRWQDNLDACGHLDTRVTGCYNTSQEFFRNRGGGLEFWGAFSLICIDGDHTVPIPLKDAQAAAANLANTGVILMHDAIGWPVRDGLRWLMDNGFYGRLFLTPHCVAIAWRGDFTPPDHIPDPHIVAQNLQARMPDFADYLARLK
jgi:hypothetical protein